MLLLNLFLHSVLRKQSPILPPKNTHDTNTKIARNFKRHSRRRKRIKPNFPKCDVTRVSRPRFRRSHFQGTTLLTEALISRRKSELATKRLATKLTNLLDACWLIYFFRAPNRQYWLQHNTHEKDKLHFIEIEKSTILI